MFKPYKVIKPFNKRRKSKFEKPDRTVHRGEILDKIEIEHMSRR